MNKIPCGIIKDLLPSYIDGILSESVNEAVKIHLEECASCRKKLEEHRQQNIDEELSSGKKGEQFIKRLKSAKHYFIGMAIGAAIPILLFLGFILYVVVMAHING
ncbi:MAG: zf-HC2 domain-containing protein [Butyrivibrio sp.]|nr:zf-HC2 domain-containing protein [Butyrivibrio sp.]